MIDIIQAAKDGESIQTKDFLLGWMDTDLEQYPFDFKSFEYRIKNPWIPHDGKTFPECNPNDLIEIDLRRMAGKVCFAGSCNWIHDGGKEDIVFWRLSKNDL